MGFFGNLIGQGLGGLAGGTIGHQKEGGAIGGTLGSMLIPFAKGGRVPGKKGKPMKAIVHGGEVVLPVGVKPTKTQKAEIRKRGGKI